MTVAGAILINDSTGIEHAVPATGLNVGRSARADIVLENPGCSRQQFRVAIVEGKVILTPLSQTTPTRVNGEIVDSSIPLDDEDEIEAAGSTFRIRILLEETGSARAGSHPRSSPKPPSTEQARRPQTSAVVPPSGPSQGRLSRLGSDRTVIGEEAASEAPSDFDQAFRLSGRMVIGRDAERVDIALPHLSVSRTHAAITLKGNKAELADLNSANGTYINGRRIMNPVQIVPGTQIEIGPFSLIFDGTHLRSVSRVNNVELVCRELSQVVTNRTTGKPLTLLDQISLVIRPKEFVCIIGPSGSGKSTLLSAISGRVPGSEGQVLVSGQDLYAHFESLKHNLAVVPQKDVLHDRLSVHDAWKYTAQLRLPPDTSAKEIEQCIDDMLETVGLQERRGTQIRHLSGGQIKRASLGNEIINKPSLLFLDEVTSGLDEQTDREMMSLFRQIADGGKTVVCITHNLANVERTCSLVVILTVGGKLAFVGSPEEARKYFGIERLGDVYDRLAQKTPEEWRNAFQQSPHCSRYIDERMPTDHDSKELLVRPVQSRPMRERVRTIGRQLGILLRRNQAIQMADLRSLLIMFGQSILVGILLIMLFGNLNEVQEESWWKESQTATANTGLPAPGGWPPGLDKPPKKLWDYSERLIFLMVISCLWFGCNNSAKEIVKERELYTRERNVNLSPSAYYLSKLLLLGILSFAQASLLFWIVVPGCELAGEGFAQWMILCGLSVTGVSLGLLLSVIARTEDMAITLVPLTLIPQIVLAGLISPLEGVAKLLAKGLITAHWGFEAVGGTLPADYEAVSRSGSEHWELAVLIVFLHFAVFAGAAMLLLTFGDQRSSPAGRRLGSRMAWKSSASPRG